MSALLIDHPPVMPANGASGSDHQHTRGGDDSGDSASTAIDVDSTDGSTSSSSSSSARRSPISAQELENIPLAGEHGLFPANSVFGRILSHLNCGLQDLRLLFMVLPCITILLFVWKQTVAGIIFAILTGLFMVTISYRLALLLRARNQAYAQLRSSEDGRRRSHRHGLGGLAMLSLAQARMNPTALRLAMRDGDFTAEDYNSLLALDDEHRAQTFNGIPASAIERLPTFAVPPTKVDPLASPKKESESVCSVCLEPKKEGEMVRLLQCLHSYHVNCIDPWLREHTKCPVCQYPVLGS